MPIYGVLGVSRPLDDVVFGPDIGFDQGFWESVIVGFYTSIELPDPLVFIRVEIQNP
jgi:hypothetical protein